ncbi:MAG: SDR family oxidoreductase [Bacteroidetes bacterium]|nr:SDR family oxidoreductase [Bacteroidota bacterium]
MDLQIKGQNFIVGGATSGFGQAIAEALLAEGANVLAIARDTDKLAALQKKYPGQVDIFPSDITAPGQVALLKEKTSGQIIHGLLINAGGPPAKTVDETTLEDWDTAYKTLLRWKVEIAKAFAPRMAEAGYGRILFIESSSVKQPLENLVLSNSLRLAAVGFAKTYALEIAAKGVNINIIAPGSHNTPAIERIYKKKSEQTGQPVEAIRQAAAKQIPVGVLGDATDFASLAIWLLSPHARYLTGQTISADGGVVRSIFG